MAKIRFYRSGLLRIISAAITPGTHPQSQSINTMKIDPQPFPMTAKGGQIIARITLQKLIFTNFNDVAVQPTIID